MERFMTAISIFWERKKKKLTHLPERGQKADVTQPGKGASWLVAGGSHCLTGRV
jgi:hypothetical protein